MITYIIWLLLSSIDSHRALFYSGQVEKRYKDGSSEIRLPNGSVRYFDPKNEHVREEWRFPDGAALTVSANGEQRIVFSNGQVEVHTKDHKVSHSFEKFSMKTSLVQLAVHWDLSRRSQPPTYTWHGAV